MADNETKTGTGSNVDPAEQARQDAAEVAARAQQARVDDATAAAERARADADRAADVATALADRNDTATADEALVEVFIAGNGLSVRLPGGGRSPFYGPGRVKVPKYVADAIGQAPTFATSGDAAGDAAARRKLERDHGVQEHVTEDESTRVLASGNEDFPQGEDAAKARKRGARTSTKEPMTKTALHELGAEDVDARYEAAVRRGKVKPIADGKGSGADGAVLKADKVEALHEAGETE